MSKRRFLEISVQTETPRESDTASRCEEACLLNLCCCTVGHITACYSILDTDMLLTLRRIGPKSDIVKTARIIDRAQRTIPLCVVSHSYKLETVRISQNPTKVTTANGEVKCQTIGLISQSYAS